MVRTPYFVFCKDEESLIDFPINAPLLIPVSTINNTTITIEQFDQAVTQAVKHVFDVMLSKEVNLVDRTIAPVTYDAGRGHMVIASVGFVGKITGSVYMCFPEAFTKAAAAHILGISESQVEMEGPDVVKDVVGELTNMTVGSFKNVLADLGYPCRLTLPVILRGSNISVSCFKLAKRQIFHFESEGHRIAVDVQMMPE